MRPIAVVLFALLAVASFQGCGSDDDEAKDNGATACPGTAKYCPQATSKSCCVADKCGFDTGTGCVATGTSDAGS
jgi:hypothetical protein